jgi:hypothetical protein
MAGDREHRGEGGITLRMADDSLTSCDSGLPSDRQNDPGSAFGPTPDLHFIRPRFASELLVAVEQTTARAHLDRERGNTSRPKMHPEGFQDQTHSLSDDSRMHPHQ